MKKTVDIKEALAKRLIDEGCVGMVWCMESCEPFNEDKFLSFKYGYLLADNEDALRNGLTHRHDLMDLYRSIEGRADNEYIDFGKDMYCVYGTAESSYWEKHCSFCVNYEVSQSQMYCCHLKRGITIRKKACNKYIPTQIQNYINKFYNGNIEDNQPGTERVE